jgi:hypothetical protein
VTKAARRGCVMMLVGLLLACGEPNQRLDEYVFYDGPHFRLKVVRYYRNIPFNYLGEHAVVMCQSESTGDFSGNDAADAGWRMLGEAPAQGGRDAREVALGAAADYQVLDDHTLVGKTNVFNISFDACGHFISWDPTRLPQVMIDAVRKPDSCAPDGPLDCRYSDFEGDRKPLYEQISVAGGGQVSFRARSPAFRGVRSLHVQTRNNGALWHVDVMGPESGRQRLQPGTVRALSMVLLEKGLADASLMEWLESELPPGSMVIWPDDLVACDERQGGGQGATSTCAQIRFNDSEGNNGTLYIDLNPVSEGGSGDASFHSGVYVTGDSPVEIRSLAGLQAAIAARAR